MFRDQLAAAEQGPACRLVRGIDRQDGAITMRLTDQRQRAIDGVDLSVGIHFPDRRCMVAGKCLAMPPAAA